MASYTGGLTTTWWFVLLLISHVGGNLSVVEGQLPGDQGRLAMYDDPLLEGPSRVRVFPDGLQPLWLKALERPAPELQRVMIDTLSIAHQRGLDGLNEFIPRLLEILDEPDQSPQVVRAILSTLVAFDAREHAQVLADVAADHGFVYSQVVEPALAKWKSPAMQQVWLQRVTQARAGDTMMIMAIDGLGALRLAAATAALTAIVRDPNRASQVRVAAAAALGNIHASGLAKLAQELLAMPSKWPALNSVLAIELLSRHEDAKSLELLQQFLEHQESAIQSRSLERLFQRDIDLVHQRVGDFVDSQDVNVRRWCLRAIIGKRELQDIRMLSGLLADVNPKLRREAAAGLLSLADDDQLRPEVLMRTTEILAQDQWRGCEQAAVVLAKLDHKPSGQRLVELLGHERGEVKAAAAWGLTQLKVESLLPEMLEHAQSTYEGFRSGQLHDGMRGMSLHLAHLFIAFGQQDFRAAEPLLRRYVPKNFDLGANPRAAAVWALGLLHEGQPDAQLTPIFVERLSDTQSMEPETSEVRQMSAISLGRMNAESVLPTLRNFAGGQDPVSRACYWAIQQMTGAPMPPLVPIVSEISDWFLAPVH